MAKNEKTKVKVGAVRQDPGEDTFSPLVDIYEHLEPGGRFYVVVISGLRNFIKRAFNEVFGNHRKIKQGKHYTVAMALRE